MVPSGEIDGESAPFQPLVVDRATVDGRATIRPIGEVDPSTVDLLAEAISEAAARGPELIEVDCSELRFLDSAGVSLLATTHRNHELGEGPRLVVTNATGIVARVLEISGVAARLTGEG